MKTRHGDIRVLNQSEISNVFESGYLGHLGCHSHNEVYVVPITYTFEDGYIYSHSRDGKKIQMMRENPRVCIQVDKVHDLFHWDSAIAWGNFEELKSDEASKAMRLLISKILRKQDISRSSSLEVDFTSMLETAIIYRIKIEKSTGKSEGSNV